MTIYGIRLPPHVQIYYKEIARIVDFEMLKPEFVVNYMVDQGALMERTHNRESANFLINMMLYIGIFTISIVLALIFGLLYTFIKSFRQRLERLYEIVWENMVFNGIIRSANLSYLTICVGFSAMIS